MFTEDEQHLFVVELVIEVFIRLVGLFGFCFFSGSGGGARMQITGMPGQNQVDISPDETMLADVRSYSNRPPELYLFANKPMDEKASGAIKPVTTSPIPEFFTNDWIDPRLVSFKARDGATVWGRLYVQENYKGGGPAVIFVHGAGYLQNVHRWWSSYYREYMFHHLLMSRGYMVLDVDYRGSKGYGRDWRTAIYRHMGGKDLDDQIDAARYGKGEDLLLMLGPVSPYGLTSPVGLQQGRFRITRNNKGETMAVNGSGNLRLFEATEQRAHIRGVKLSQRVTTMVRQSRPGPVPLADLEDAIRTFARAK